MTAYQSAVADGRSADWGTEPPSRPRRKVGLGAFLVLGLLLVAVAPNSVLLPRVQVRGAVLDDVSDRPIGGARVAGQIGTVETGEDGRFTLGRAALTESIMVERDGYEPARVSVWPPRGIEVSLVPRTFSLTVRDAETGAPVTEAAVAADPARAERAEPGRFRIGPAPAGTTMLVKAAGYGDASLTYRGEGDVEARLQRKLVGTVVDASTNKPVQNAFIGFAGGSALSDRDGAFELTARPAGSLRVLAPGYRRAEVQASDHQAVRLEPFHPKALYLSFYGVGDRGLRTSALGIVEKTEVNALVIDVKGDRGWLAYRSAVPLADAIGANDEPTVSDIGELLQSLKQRGIYTIARIVTFKDDKLARYGARAGLDVAIKDSRSGGPWIDGEDLGWVDPFREEVWEYNIALAREAAEKGFDEIQFDYIRFPTDPSAATSMGAARYSKPVNEAARVQALTSFLRRARDAVREAGAFLAIDVFGYVTLDSDDVGIGQQLEALAEVVDYICPMVYPSAYSAGLPGKVNFPQVIARPYDVVFESMKRARERTAGRGAVMRPWLQYFDDYPWETRKAYNAPEINAQRKGASDAGSIGWMMWDPSNKYSRGGFAPKP